ncbi:MAG: SpoIIE family protein phosphatase [Bacteroidales bacterium]|nr:SpoIIE family protein phosphatase [Bacteroidales bacterium]
MGRYVHKLMIIVLALFGVLLAPQDALCQRKRDRSKDKENDSLKQIVVDYTLSDSDKERVQSGIKLANYYLNENDVQCVEQANATIKIATKSKMNTEVGELYGIIGSYYYNNKNYKKAATAWESGYSILKKNNLAIPRAQICYQLGQCHQKLKNNRKARNYYDEAMTLAKKLGDRELMHTLTRSLCDIMLSDKNYKMAYEYLNAYFQEEKNKLGNQNAKLRDLNEEQEQIIEQKDSTIQEVVNQNYQLEMQRQQLKYDSAKLEFVRRQQEDSIERVNIVYASLKEKDEFNKKMRVFLIIVIVLIAGVIVLILRNNRQKKRANTILQEKNHMISSQNEEIQRQNEEISKNLEEIAVKNKDITDSLNYAGTIQKAMLRDFEKHRTLMSDYFIFYAPKDIVSGDFYWAYKVDSKFVFTVGDCTGHSVPGAFMSMLGIALLNQIVAQQHILQASQILEQMRIMVKQYLGQTGLDESEAPKDGMDMALCVWDLDSNNCNFAGAYNPMIMVRRGELKVFAAVKSPVGIHMRELPFEDQYVDLQKGDRLFLFSDGYSDQFSSVRHDKFKMSRFRQLLLESSRLPMSDQRNKLVDNYYAWKGDFMQIDDVCVLGVEI